jgi:putative ABC transport system permease protein
MESLFQDLRYAVRSVRRMRGMAAIAIATLAIGIAATTTMFSVVYAALLRPLPFPDPDRLVMLYVVRQAPRTGRVDLRWPVAKITALQQSVQAFESMASYTSAASVSVAGDAGAEQLDTEIISAAYLRVLDVQIAAGRGFLDEEDGPGHAVAVASVELWRRYFGETAFTPDRTLLVNAIPLTIVGLLPGSFGGLSGRAQLWIPIGMAPQLTYRDYLTTPQHFINLIARLRPDVPLAQANAELAALGPRLPRISSPSEEPATWSAIARPLGEVRIDPGLRRSALILFSAVACLLLVTCINVAALLLTRARLREREIGIRIAIGAGRRRIVQQLLTETGVLALCGGGLGVLLTSWGIAWCRRFSPDMLGPTHTGYVQLAAFASPTMDAVALMCTVILTVGCTLLAGLAPALHTVSANPARAVAQSTRSATVSGRGRTLRTLAGAQVTIAVLLVAGALLLLASFIRLQQTRVGFDPSRVLVFWITPPGSRYGPETGPTVIERVLQRVQGVPGVSLAAVNRCTPFSSSCARTIVFFPERPTPPALAPSVGRHYVSADYFRTLGIRVVKGRVLTDNDRPSRPPVTVINEAAARRFWPGEDPIGRHVWFGSATGFTDPARPVEFVGVVSDVKYWPLTEPPGPDFYTSYLQFAYPDTGVIVQAAGDPSALVPSLRGAIASVDRTIPLYDVRLLNDRVSEVLSRPRFNAIGMAAFAGITMLLASMGIFGAISAGVAARTRELAIRLALGATSGGLRRLVLGQALQVAIIGSVLGLGAAWIGLGALRGVLFGVTPTDPLLLGASTGLMPVVALLAAIQPARRAGATDPMVALKSE